MAKIPVRFKRVAAAFNEVAARVRLCESSGSEHSPAESFTDLSDLVKCFIERDGVVEAKADEVEGNESQRESYWRDSETKEMLQGLLIGNKDDDDKLRIYENTEFACKLIEDEDRSSQGFKRRLMTHLRDRGLDAGLCKSRWEKNGRCPSGSYEYVDVNLGTSRYIIEVNLAAQFEIARATDGYMSLLSVFPPIFVGKPEVLQQIVRLMCAAAKVSIKRADMSVAPWRRGGYMQAKWFSSYKRTTSAVPASKTMKFDEAFAKNRSIGFVALPVRPCYCRDDFASEAVLRVGQLTAAFSGNDMGG